MSKREIKFRYWDGQEIHYVDLYFFEEHGIREWPADKNHYGAKELMQYTGPEDPHGKELYEDDIVQYAESVVDEGENYQLTSRGVIAWDEEKAAFVISWRAGGKEYDAIFMDDNRDVARIGNIHQHPELLGQ